MEKDCHVTADNVVQVDFKERRALDQGLNKKKRELFELWIAEGTVCLLFDARSSEVKVPKEFKQRGDLRLNFCHSFQVADFNFNEHGVWATLSFDSGEFFCSVPWAHVYGMQSAKLNQGAVWFDNFPKDYDQIAVLGFSEEMCEHEADAVDDSPSDSVAQVVELDFGHKNRV